jgi:hypothetical protein
MIPMEKFTWIAPRIKQPTKKIPRSGILQNSFEKL